MCSCSGSCNCNSTTIPKGPQGNPGTNGTDGAAATVTAGVATVLPVGSNPTVTNSSTNPSAAVFNFGIPTGATGLQGPQGPQGINAFTTLIDDFMQPAIGGGDTIYVVNSSWMAVGEIIYIGPGLYGAPPPPGGFYQVTGLPAAGYVGIKNLGWVIPGTTFALQGQTVGTAGTIVTPSGTIGANSNNAYILDAKWGEYLGNGGSNDFKTSIFVPGNTLLEMDDVLECQTIFRIIDINSEFKYFYIKISTIDNDGGSGVSVYLNQLDIPIVAGDDYVTVHMNYKIQRVTSTSFRSKGETFLSLPTEYTPPGLFSCLIDQTYVCNSIYGAISLPSSSNWSDDLYVTVVVNDEPVPVISVVHHEVKVVKKLI